MKNIKRKMYLIFSIVLLTSCTHTIQLNPPLEDIRATEVSRKINKNVGYYISDENRVKEVTSPGGGGDTVSYKPYKDTEGALNTILSKIFSTAYSIKNLNDNNYISEKNISYIFIPSIKTDSSSSSIFTWPPTVFEFELTCVIVDAKGKTISEKTVSAAGNAEYDEFINDFSLSARRATNNAFMKMMEEISTANEL